MRVSLHLISMLMSIATIIIAAPVFASDGQLEINQACAVNTGCFTGDAPGFPVTITTPGSYRLTGSLDLSAEGVNVSGVAVSVPAVTIDLGGFHIAGPTSCSGSGTTVSCSPSSTGVGSAGVQFTINATAGVVQNGIVRNMTNFGIFSQATGLRVQNITAIHNGRDGITGREGSLVVNSVAIENGQDGVDINTGSVVDGITAIGNGSNGIRGQGSGSVVTRTSVRHNGMRGFFLGLQYKFGKDNASSGNGEADQCGEGECTDRTRLYQTRTSYSGSGVLTACKLGFRPATVAEVQNFGNYHYDTTLGAIGFGPSAGFPPWNWGWATGSEGPSLYCDGYTTTASTGILVSISPIPLEVYNGEIASVRSLIIEQGYCFLEYGVWCVED